jgi:hypothetical protein
MLRMDQHKLEFAFRVAAMKRAVDLKVTKARSRWRD